MNNPPSAEWFLSERMARGYALYRPPIHRQILDLVRGGLKVEAVNLALDVGCGAGLSTRALLGWVRRAIGLEPSLAMLAHAGGADFVAGRAEALPFADATFDLATAAGALNWSDLLAVWPETRRVLQSGGHFVLYDFGPGLLTGDAAVWHTLFSERYPFPPALRIEPASLPENAYGLRREHVSPFEIELAWNRAAYLEYALTETNVEAAIARGVDEVHIRTWCKERLFSLLADGEIVVRFEGFWAAYQAE